MLTLIFVLGTVSILVGWFGNCCAFWALNAPYNAPRICENGIFRICHFLLSFLITAAFAYTSCLYLTHLYEFSSPISILVFIALFIFRWMISGLIAQLTESSALSRIRKNEFLGTEEYVNDFENIDKKFFEITSQHIKDSNLDEFLQIIDKRPQLLEQTNDQGASLLHLVAAQGIDTNNSHLIMAEYLLSRNINPNCRTLVGWTPLHLIVINGSERSIPIAKLLLENGADINAKANDGETDWRVLWQHGQELYQFMKKYTQ